MKIENYHHLTNKNELRMNYLLICVASAFVTLLLCERLIIRGYHRDHEALLRKQGDLYERLGEKIEHNMSISIDLYKTELEVDSLKEENKRLKTHLAKEQALRCKQNKDRARLREQNAKLHKELLEQIEHQNEDEQ